MAGVRRGLQSAEYREPERLRGQSAGSQLRTAELALQQHFRAARTENAAEARARLSEAGSQQIVHVAAQVRGIQQIEDLAEHLPLDALLISEDLRHAQVLRV